MTESDKRTCILARESLEKFRKERGLSMQELADVVGRDIKTMRRVFGMRPTYVSTARALAEALNVELISLLELPSPVSINREHQGYEFSITTVGVVESAEQMAMISDIANEIVQRLSAMNVKVVVHEQNLKSAETSVPSPYAVVRVNAPRHNLRKCAYPGMREAKNFAYIIVSLEDHYRLLNTDDWNERCVDLFINHKHAFELAILSGEIWDGRDECKIIDSALRTCCIDDR